MPNYNNGKIYVIRNHINDKQYVGSTTQTLSQRYGKNYGENTVSKSHFPLMKAIKEIGKKHFYIELIENYPCSSKNELEAREGYWIRQKDTYRNGYNLRIAGRTKQEYVEDNRENITQYQKQYRKDNKEDIINSKKEWYEKNRDKKIEDAKQYVESHKEKVAETKKAWYERNKERLNQEHKEKYQQDREKRLAQVKANYEKNKKKKLAYAKEY